MTRIGRHWLALALLSLAACIEQTNLTSTGPSGGGLGPLPGSTIDRLRIEPSQFELTNGQQATAIVIGEVGGVEVRDFDFTASIGPNTRVATILQVTGNVILFKGENPGDTALRITAGRSEAEANIRVVPGD